MNSDFNNVCSALRRIMLLSSVCLAAGLVGCSASNPGAGTQVEKASVVTSTEKAAPADALLQEAVFAKALTKNNEPDKPSTDFAPDETICLALKLKGRPTTGIVTAKFYCENDFITEAKVDVATVNNGVLLSIGESTFVGFSLKHSKAFPVSSKYRAEVFFNDKPLGTYKFNVVAPAGDTTAKSSETAAAPTQ